MCIPLPWLEGCLLGDGGPFSVGRAVLEVRGCLAWEPRDTSPACQVRPAHARRGMGASMSHCSKAWRSKQRGIFFVCVYIIFQGCSLTFICARAAPYRQLTAFLLSEGKSILCCKATP